MIVLDASAIIELLAGTEKGEQVRTILQNEAAAASAVTINEVLISARDRQRLHDFFKSLHVLPFDDEAAYASIKIEESLRKKGRMIGKLDIFVAATCIVHMLPVLTADKDFQQVDGLKVVLV